MKKILVVDNYDSFTYNLVHYLWQAGAETEVVRNDTHSVEELLAKKPRGILISPGPCSPNEAGICLDLIKALPDQIPLLGVCLGHQAIAQAYGGEVIAAEHIMHGKTSEIFHEKNGVLAGIPHPFVATRYHSLAVRRNNLPADLIINARTFDGEIMGLRHVSKPVHGVQFHPESIATEHGHEIIDNFLKLCHG